MKKTFFIFILVNALMLLSFPLAIAKGEKALKVLKQTGGVVSGITVGPFVGGFRGWLIGLQAGTDVTAELLGDRDGSVHRMIGFFPSGFVASLGGGYFGFLMGAYDGATYGMSDPFSKESFSLTGDSLLDYELF